MIFHSFPFIKLNVLSDYAPPVFKLYILNCVIILFKSFVVPQSQFLFYLAAHRETVEEECHPSISSAKFDTSSGQTSSLQANL